MPKPKLVIDESTPINGNGKAFNWADIKTIDDMIRLIPAENIYDCTPIEGDNIYDVPIKQSVLDEYGIVNEAKTVLGQKILRRPKISEIARYMGISEWEVYSALFRYDNAVKWAPRTRGIILCHGPEGGGKSMIMFTLMFMFRELFEKLPISDTKPRPEFGFVIPFDYDFFLEQLKRINELVSVHNNTLYKNKSGMWESPSGIVFVYDSTIGLDEFSNDMHRMKQSSRKSRTWAQYFKVWRHTKSCIICCDADKRSIDPNYAMPRVTCSIECRPHETIDDAYLYDLTPLRYNTNKKTLVTTGRKERFYIAGNEPHPGLNGLRPFEIFNTENPQKIDTSALEKELKQRG